MARLRIQTPDGEVTTLELLPGREYTMGRAEDCDVRLTKSSISRRHVRFFQSEDGVWQAEILSRFGTIQRGSSSSQNLSLQKSTRFSVDDYQMEFHATDSAVVVNAQEESPLLKTEVRESRTELVSEEDIRQQADSDRTSVGAFEPVVTLKMTSHEQPAPVTMKLQGEEWTAGRGSSSDIKVSDAKSSRKHFKIRKARAGYEVVDLGSSNGTRLNGIPLPGNKPLPLQSGDVLQVGQASFLFEVFDPRFAQMMKQVPNNLLVPVSSQAPIQLEQRQVASALPSVSVVRPVGKFGKGYAPPFKVTPARIGIGLVVLIAVWFSLTDSPSNKRDLNSQVSPGVPNNPADPVSELTPEQKILLEDSYNLANNLYMQGKYEAAVIEVKKVHQLVPAYKESQTLLTNSRRGIEIKAQQDEIERRNREEQILAQRLRANVADCESQAERGNATFAAMESCLSQVFEMDPDNAEAKALLGRVEREQDARERKRAERQAFQEKVDRSKALYQNAKDAEERKDWQDALTLYEKFVQTDSPGMADQKTKAKARIPKLKEEIGKEIGDRQTKAKDMLGQKDYKGAMDQLDRAMKLDPQNKSNKQLHEKANTELYKKIRELYGDSVLEENLGNIESAKQKWKTIMEMDSEGGEYYTKARTRLIRYGEIKDERVPAGGN